MRPRLPLLRQPLLRLLAVNLAAGVGVAVLMLGGLLALNPGGLRDLILTDRAGAAALALLLLGLVVMFASVVMGSAVMMLGRKRAGGGKGGQTKPAHARIQNREQPR